MQDYTMAELIDALGEERYFEIQMETLKAEMLKRGMEFHPPDKINQAELREVAITELLDVFGAEKSIEILRGYKSLSADIPMEERLDTALKMAA